MLYIKVTFCSHSFSSLVHSTKLKSVHNHRYLKIGLIYLRMPKTLFPYDTVRPIQEDMVKAVHETISKKENLIVHAPTGLGKTVASLAPAIDIALKKKLTVFFLTSRQTQHHLAIETIKDIKQKNVLDLTGVDLIGKQTMCQGHMTKKDLDVDGIKDLKQNECDYLQNTKSKNGKLKPEAEILLGQLRRRSPLHAEYIIKEAERQELCPYEISMILAKEANVIVGDYYHIFHSHISHALFSKTGKTLEDSIIIIDEGHNLPSRLRNLATHKLSTYILGRAKKEAEEFDYPELIPIINELNLLLQRLLDSDEEKKVDKKVFESEIEQIKEYDELIEDIDDAATQILKLQTNCYLASISDFLEAWRGPDKGFTRIISLQTYNDNQSITLSYSCLDPSLASTVIFEHSYATILMSGTLTPTSMYREVLGYPKNTTEIEFDNPFPKQNKLTLIVPKTTTKFTQRDENQFREIARICADITNSIDGNSAIFLPSYALLDQVHKQFAKITHKQIVREVPGLSKEGRQDMLEQFKSFKKEGAVLLGAASGSFGEGIDLPGDLLKGVIVVGIPLPKPDLETKEIINYYDEKFSKGWDYGYVLPAILTSLQNAGRCIRSETDRGVVVFLDERYAWPSYRRCFSKDLHTITTENYTDEIVNFFHHS